MDQTYQYTTRWFRSRNRGTFQNFVYPRWKDQPITYLEIGVFEGQSMCWMLENVLTHPDARAVGIDPWLMTWKRSPEEMENVMNRAHHNVQLTQGGEKCRLIRGNSNDVLQAMHKSDGYAGIKKGTVDICMVDGEHSKYFAYNDAKLSLRLIRPGGWLLFDDVEDVVKKQEHAKGGIEMFLDEFGSSVTLAWKHRFMECYEVIL